MAVALDTLKFANTLKAAGVPDKQAEAQAAAFAEAFQVNLKDLATKDDLAHLGKATKDDLAHLGKATKDDLTALGKDIRHEVKELESRIGNRFDQVAAETKAIRTELKGDINLLRWMCGLNTMLVVGIFVRLFFYAGR